MIVINVNIKEYMKLTMFRVGLALFFLSFLSFSAPADFPLSIYVPAFEYAGIDTYTLQNDEKVPIKGGIMTIAQKLTIDIWNGTSQKIGHLGSNPQADFNLMGHVNHPYSLVRPGGLTYKLNDRAPIALSYLAYRRLLADGDFNADIPVKLLKPGKNRVIIEAVDTSGQRVVQTVTITRERGSYPLPVNIHWSDVKNPQDVGQYVDGRWGLVAGGLRTLDIGYDRLFLLGEANWQDYEITVPVTIHPLRNFVSPLSYGYGVGIILRFTGHVVGGCKNYPAVQPKWGYQPFGSICWIWRNWKKEMTQEPFEIQYYRGDKDISVISGKILIKEEETYRMKCRCETLPDAADGSGVTCYSYKIWQDGQPEPINWNWQQVQTSQCALRKGGIAFVANNVDATFGDVHVQNIPVGHQKKKKL